MCIYRGINCFDNKEEEKFLMCDEKIYKNEVNYFWYRDSHNIFKNEKHLTLINNSNFINEELENTINKASKMLNAGAYLNQYNKYGIDKSDFMDVFALMEQIIFDYK
jgi:hypothetical protein